MGGSGRGGRAAGDYSEGGLQAAAASTALPVTAEAGALVTAEGTAVKTSTEHGVV